jgi:hypothetical protein
MCLCPPPASLIELLAEVLDAQQNLFGKRTQTMEKWLKRYLRSGFVLRYERRKEIASDETMIDSQTVQPFVLTPTLVRSEGGREGREGRRGKEGRERGRKGGREGRRGRRGRKEGGKESEGRRGRGKEVGKGEGEGGEKERGGG